MTDGTADRGIIAQETAELRERSRRSLESAAAERVSAADPAVPRLLCVPKVSHARALQSPGSLVARDDADRAAPRGAADDPLSAARAGFAAALVLVLVWAWLFARRTGRRNEGE